MSDNDLRTTVRTAVQRRKAARDGVDEIAEAARHAENRPRILIGV